MPRGIDHLVLAVRDLDAAVAFYRALGFTVGSRNRHAWGTLNHIVQMPGQFLELIATEPGFQKPQPDEPVHNFAGFLSDYLEHREGLAMLVLESNDAKADLQAFRAAGIGKPEAFFFERRGKRPDGSDVHLAFTLAFAAAPATVDAGFFVAQQHVPENFWNPAFQQHPNGVTGIAAVVLEASDPLMLSPFLTGFSGQDVTTTLPSSAGAGFALDTGRGAIEVVAPDEARTAAADRDTSTPCFVAVRFLCTSPDALRNCLRHHHIAFKEHAGAIVVPASHAFGVALVFKEAA
jgi:catechol 2,3-dioxygenase-like lactoylglutathione lyase family enzyme